MNRKLAIVTSCILFLLLCSGTMYKVIKQHHDNLLLVSEKYIIEQATLCYEEKKCTNDIVTLKELYDLSYLTPQVNPIHKEYYNEESYIQKEENSYAFIVVD